MILAAAALTLAAAVNYALDHSPSVVKAQAALAQAHSQYVRQRSQELPGVNGTLSNQMSKSANYQGAYSVIGASQAAVFSQNTAQLGTQYTWNGGLSHLQTAIARQTYDQAQADLRQAQDQVASDVTAAYYTLAAKNEAVRLDEGDLQYQRLLVHIARAKERAGVAAGVDTLSANAQEEKSKYTLEAARADEQNAREALAQLIGAPLDMQFAAAQTVAQPPLPAQPLNQLIATAIANRPEIASARESVQIAQLNRASADRDLWPQISTAAAFGNQYSPTNAAQLAQFGAAASHYGFWNIGVQTSFSLPFWDWGARRANHANLNEQIASQETALGAARTQAELDVRRQYRAAQTALAQLASAQDETRYALEAARVAKLQYEHGLKTLTDVLAAQQASLSAQTDAFNARVAYAGAIVNLRVALGIYDARSAVADL
jgi:multidrug efflux system outer membrane protein